MSLRQSGFGGLGSWVKVCLVLGLLGTFMPAGQSQFGLQRGAAPVSPELEAMYVRGLGYLQRAQSADGTFEGTYGNEPGVIGLAMMSFLAYGDDPNSGAYSESIRRCLNAILAVQRDGGYIGNNMYTHGFATLALAEAYGMVEDARIATALKRAVDLILTAQKNNRTGGWRYSPDASDADTTVTGCQLVALYAARNAGIPVPQAALDRAHEYMRSCQASSGAYGYTSKANARVTLTAIGTLTLALGKKKETASFKRGVNFLRDKLTYQDSNYFYYFLYYMAQATFQADEAMWDEWNQRNIRLLRASQSPDGHWAGGKSHAYSTSCALLSLALNYRFLPIYEK